MKKSERPKEEIEVMKSCGFVWKNTSVFDDELQGAGHWFSESGFKVIPIGSEYGDWEYTILQFAVPSLILEYADGEEIIDVNMLEEGENVVYCGYIDFEDTDFVNKLFRNLEITFDVDEV